MCALRGAVLKRLGLPAAWGVRGAVLKPLGQAGRMLLLQLTQRESLSNVTLRRQSPVTDKEEPTVQALRKSDTSEIVLLNIDESDFLFKK